MIFVTVGSQRPFDRLISAVDEWAGLRGRSDVFAQVAGSKHCPRHIRFTRFIEAPEFSRWIENASIVVGHAGTGTIIRALEFGKPILVMPRRRRFHEAHDDHQVATARWFEEQRRAVVVEDEQQLARKLDQGSTLAGALPILQASPALLATIREFLTQGTWEQTIRRSN